MKHDAAVHVPIINVISKQYSVFNHEGMDSFDGCSFTSAKIICEFWISNFSFSKSLIVKETSESCFRVKLEERDFQSSWVLEYRNRASEVLRGRKYF